MDAVLVEQAIDVDKEIYAAIVIDGSEGGAVAMVSAAGGMDIEEVAERTPEKIVRAAVDPVLGLMPYQGRALALGIGVDPKAGQAHIRHVGAPLRRLHLQRLLAC